MFDHASYVGYTALFCLPPLVLIWLRGEFFRVLATKLKPILISTVVLTVYGSLIWPIALTYGAWAYASDKITGVKVFGFVYIDDVFWWLLVSFLFASAVSLSTHYEAQGVDIFWREIKGLFRGFMNAFRGFRMIPLERNSTIHVAVAVFVLLEAILFKISKLEWLFVVVAIAFVLGFEIFNSCLERITSWPSDAREHEAAAGGENGADQRDKEIGLIKDAAASGVLISAIAAGLVGVMIFSNSFFGRLL